MAKGTFYQQAAAPTALDALPARPAGFTGRGEELEELLRAFDPTVTGGPEAVLVAALSGLGGIGKTALAVEAAHEACEKGWFPGGVLFLDLHGYDDDPVTGEQALEALLRAVGVEPEHIPVGVDERGALYRSVLAERGRERGAVLVVADNASSPGQVRPLLPGEGRHRLLVTSRSKLPQLGARLLALDELAPREAFELLDGALRVADPADSRVAEEAEAAMHVASHCGCLPLALQIAAALLVLDRGKPVAELAAELSEFRDRLVHLDDGERSVRAAFDLSYRRLPPDQARLLRLLALAPGAEVTTEAVTALSGEDAPPTRALGELARAHLVGRGSTRGRWRLHDLVRAFGVATVAHRADFVEEGNAARWRLLEYFHRWATAADQRLEWFPGRPEPERFADRAAAFEWLDREREGLVAAVQWAHERPYADMAVSLAERLVTYLSRRRYSDDWIMVASTARGVAHRSGHRRAEAGAWESLGGALRQAGRDDEAVDAHRRACDLFRAAGDADREVFARNQLGIALQKVGRLEEAIDVHLSDLDLFRTAGDRRGEGIAWINLGGALREAGRLEEAIDAHTRARDLFRRVGDRHHEGYAWSNLGSALQQVGRVEEAIESFKESLEYYTEFEDWYAEGLTLEMLARAYEDAQEPSKARSCRLRAADSFTRAMAPDRAAAARTAAAEPLTP
ncbi:tetratricopeptide repeat protein [Streptomyces sp. CA-251387]|uniref:tetratricopeptide repeat protein n=1 Tax=Streptomyces sp. CA-251387 TaxID=3240064 RepID=UPI003D901781